MTSGLLRISSGVPFASGVPGSPRKCDRKCPSPASYLVLNQQNGGVVMMITQFGNQLVQLFGLFRVEGRRPVRQHQDFWLGHHAAGNLSRRWSP